MLTICAVWELDDESVAKSNTTFKDDFWEENIRIEWVQWCFCVSFFEEVADDEFKGQLHVVDFGCTLSVCPPGS